MADASNMNSAGVGKTQEGGCLTHYRRGFVKSYRGAKKAATYVIKKLQEVYRVESEAKRLNLSPEARLKLHQEKSGPIMEELELWMTKCLLSLTSAGKVPFYKFGRRNRFLLSELKKLLLAQPRGGNHGNKI